MTQSPFPLPGPNKPFPGKQVSMPAAGSGGGTGRACGCFVIGCGGVLALCITLCGVGYYVFNYTAVPLDYVKQALEETGDVKIEGLTGNINNGIEIDSVQFRNGDSSDENQEWSKLENLKAKYHGLRMFGSSDVVIEEVSVGSGQIYASIGNSENDIGAVPIDTTFDANDEFRRGWSEASFPKSGGNFRVDKVNIRDLSIIDKNNDVEFKIEEILYEGLKIQNGQLTNIGDLTIKTDNLELKTTPSSLFDDSLNSRHVEGRVKPGVMANIVREIPFELDLKLESRGSVFRGTCFEKQIAFEYLPPDKLAKITFTNYTPDDFLDAKRRSVWPQNVNLTLRFEPQRSLAPKELAPGASFELGQTKFDDVKLTVAPARNSADESANAAATANENNWMVATKTIDGETVHAMIAVTNRVPFLRVTLTSDSGTQSEIEWQNLWAKVAYGKSFDSLDDDQKDRTRESVRRQMVRTAIEKPASPTNDVSSGNEPSRTHDDETGGEKNPNEAAKK